MLTGYQVLNLKKLLNVIQSLDIVKKDNPVTLTFIDENTVKLEFDQPVKSVTPGQAAVFYDGDVCLGGGTIEKVYKDGKEIEYL